MGTTDCVSLSWSLNSVMKCRGVKSETPNAEMCTRGCESRICQLFSAAVHSDQFCVPWMPSVLLGVGDLQRLNTDRGCICTVGEGVDNSLLRENTHFMLNLSPSAVTSGLFPWTTSQAVPPKKWKHLFWGRNQVCTAYGYWMILLGNPYLHHSWLLSCSDHYFECLRWMG